MLKICTRCNFRRGAPCYNGLNMRQGVGGQFNPLEFYEAHQEDMDTLGIQLVQKPAEKVRYQRTFGINTLTVLFDRGGSV